MSFEQQFNAVEAAFWFLLAGLAIQFGHRTFGFTPNRQRALSFFLIGFGLSDVWEIHSGIWWRPPALLVLKAVCLSGLLVTAGAIYATRWRLSSKKT